MLMETKIKSMPLIYGKDTSIYYIQIIGAVIYIMHEVKKSTIPWSKYGTLGII